MTPDQKELVIRSWAQVKVIGEQAAELFYKKLFELDPSLKRLFHSDMADQGKRLIVMIDAAINKLDDIPALIPVLEQLGKRHHEYGVKNTDYETVASALIWTLAQGLGDAFTKDVKKAWVIVYSLIAQTMKNTKSMAA